MPRRVLHDRYFRQAKADGYLARSAYKLLEIQRRRSVLRPGEAVLDLGCAPGSWSQVASGIVGQRGLVVGVDLTPVRAALGPNVVTLAGDFTTLHANDLLAPLAHTGRSQYDVVISDMAPNTSGAGDHFRSVRLCEAILDRLRGVLRPGGRLVYKVFEGEAYPDLLARTGAMFATCRGVRPKATREVSREMFVVASGYEPASEARPASAAPPAPEPQRGWGR